MVTGTQAHVNNPTFPYLKLSSCSECFILSFGWFPPLMNFMCRRFGTLSVPSVPRFRNTVYSICADVSEYCLFHLCRLFGIPCLFHLCRRFGTLCLFQLYRRFGTFRAVPSMPAFRHTVCSICADVSEQSAPPVPTFRNTQSVPSVSTFRNTLFHL